MSAVHTCPICDSERIDEFLRRNAVPVHQNLIFASRKDALQVARGDLVFTVCHECGFVFNHAFDQSNLAYNADYDNTQSHSPHFARYMADLARHLVDTEDVRGSRIVEIGCGKGVFLRLLVDDPAYGNSGIGFDPTYVGPETELEGRLRFERRFYDESCADIAADVVVCRHVIEHVPQPRELLRTVRLALGNARSARVYFETPCVEWMLRNLVIWDFFYEHCSLFNASSLRTAFERTGFAVHNVRHVFGDQYLWLEAGLAEKSNDNFVEASDIPILAQQFTVAEEKLRLEWRERLVCLAAEGKVAIWGAGAKGATFANLVDTKNELIDCVIDLNPKKQGKFVPGTGHPIVGVETFAARGVRSAILMNPNYREENEALLAANGITIQLIE